MKQFGSAVKGEEALLKEERRKGGLFNRSLSRRLGPAGLAGQLLERQPRKPGKLHSSS